MSNEDPKELSENELNQIAGGVHGGSSSDSSVYQSPTRQRAKVGNQNSSSGSSAGSN